MYAESGLFFSYMQNFSQDFQQLEVYCKSNKPNSSMSNIMEASGISEYDLGGEGDLFKAPEPITEEPFGSLDPMRAAIFMISGGGGGGGGGGEDAIATQGHIESCPSEQLLNEVFNEWEKDHMDNSAFSEVLDIKIPIVMTANQNQHEVQDNKLVCDVSFQKSVSSGCLPSMDLETSMKPNFLDFSAMDMGSVYGMRRAFSEGDIKTLGNGNNTSSLEHQPLMITGCTSEVRKEKLSRYRNKKNKRNFGRKIKVNLNHTALIQTSLYRFLHIWSGSWFTESEQSIARFKELDLFGQYACRKALADSQPRIRGRFAKTEGLEAWKRQ